MKKALLTVGNLLRGDDGVAEFVGKKVEEKLGWKVFYGGNVPENTFHLIRKFNPDILVVVDAVTGIKEKDVYFFELDEESDYIYTTHNLPLPVLIKYLKEMCRVVLFLGIGVDPAKTIRVNPELSESARKSVDKAFEKISQLNSLLIGNSPEELVL
jgi:hydrogenase 3 maturation protease